MEKEQLTLYAVTDRLWLSGRTLAEAVEEAVRGGATLVQLREKDMSEEDFIKSALEIKKVCRKYGVKLIINDSVSVALAADADGVHLGQGDTPLPEARRVLGKDKIIGVTAKTVEQAIKAERDGADYLGSGAVFGTSTKADAKKMDMTTLRSITAAVKIPVVAIGGITAKNIARLKNTGISGAAVVSGIFAHDNILGATQTLLAEVKKVTEQKMKTALTIAGSDSGGGAGIQADLKTMLSNGVYGMSVITSVTSQNTTGVYGIFDIPADTVKSQLDAVFSDIFPDAVKIGMVSSAEIIEAISEKLRQYNAKNVVLDPVMVSTSGSRLISESAINALTSSLFPLADVITPNIPEAEVLSGMEIKTENDMAYAAKAIADKYGVSVLLKGGHFTDTARDILIHNGNVVRYEGEHIKNPNTHGTGCTLSSAVASNLANGADLETAVRLAKDYVTGAIRDNMDLGHGRGPLNHGYGISR